MDVKLDIIAIIISAIAFAFSVYSSWYSKKVSKYMTLKEYYEEDNTKERIEARYKIYQMSEEEMKDLTMVDTERAWVSSYYQFYAILYFNNVIDREAYRKVFGLVTVNIYHKLEPYIKARRSRDGDDKDYASEFQKLVEDIEKYQEG